MSIDSPSAPKHSALYSDLNSLQSLKTQARNNDPEALREVARQFEQIFLNQMLKSMRDANESFSDPDNVFTGGDVRFFQDMMDQQMTMEMVQGRGIGLTEVLVKQLSNQMGIAMNEKPPGSEALNVTPGSWILKSYGNQANLAAAAVLGDYNFAPDKDDIALQNSIAELEKLKSDLYRKNSVEVPEQFDSPQHFVASLLPMAESVAKELGVNPKVLLAQAALETGWGKHMVRDNTGQNSFNLFNIKAGSRWSGDVAAANSLEFKDGVMSREVSKFRSYASYEESFKDYGQFLQNSPRYQEALDAAADPHKYVQLLQKAGYATDPKYAEKISSIFNSDILGKSAKSPNEG